MWENWLIWFCVGKSCDVKDLIIDRMVSNWRFNCFSCLHECGPDDCVSWNVRVGPSCSWICSDIDFDIVVDVWNCSNRLWWWHNTVTLDLFVIYVNCLLKNCIFFQVWVSRVYYRWNITENENNLHRSMKNKPVSQ